VSTNLRDEATNKLIGFSRFAVLKPDEDYKIGKEGYIKAFSQENEADAW